MEHWIVGIPIVFPIISGLLISVLNIFENRKIRNCYIMSVLTLELLMVFLLASQCGTVFTAFTLVQGIPVSFHVDEVGILFTGVMAILWWISGLYALEYMKHDGGERRYFTFYIIAEGILVALCYAGNLVTLYAFFECMTLLTMPLVLHTRTKESVRAARKYMFYSIFGASCSLGGIFILANFAPSITFAPGGIFTPETFASHETMYFVAAICMIVGFSGKAGMFPLHGWLPTAHPQAPSPASAVLSGIITKMGVVSVIRTVFFIFGADIIRGTWIQTFWMSMALITIFMGSMMAYKEPLMKRRFAYSTVSQVSYIILGLSTLTEEGVTGGLLHVVFHGFAKMALFLLSGIVIYYTGKKQVRELSGLGKRMRLVFECYTIASLALVGMPPFSGFVSKEFLAHGALASGVPFLSMAGPVVLLISAVLTAGYLFSISLDSFYPKGEMPEEAVIRVDWKMWVPMVMLAAGAIILGVYPGPLLGFVEKIAAILV